MVTDHKHKFLMTIQVAEIMGLSHAVLTKHGFYGMLTNHSSSDRFRMYDESEVLAKKQLFLDQYAVKLAAFKEYRIEHGKKRAADMLAKGQQYKGGRTTATRYKTMIKTHQVSNADLIERLALLKQIAELENKVNN